MVFNDSFGLIFIHQNQNGFCLDNSLYRVYYSGRAEKKCLQRWLVFLFIYVQKILEEQQKSEFMKTNLHKGCMKPSFVAAKLRINN